MKFKINKSAIMLCARWSLFFALVVFLVAGGYFYLVVNELRLKLNETQISESVVAQTVSHLDQNSLIHTRVLNEFDLFYKNRDEYIEFQKNREEQQEDIGKGIISFNEDLEVPSLLENTCHRFMCLQFRRKFKDIPSSLWKGLLGTEDFRFLDHQGVDPIAIARALFVDIVAMKFIQGGSTLTQQLVKNLFLTNEKTLTRKFKEMIYALYIENILSKEDILTLYLNEVFWGTYQGVYIKGFYAASIAYFRKPPEELSNFEATILISLLKGPQYYNPKSHLDRLKDRSLAVYKRLQEIKLMPAIETAWNDKEWSKYQKKYIQKSQRKYLRYYYQLSQNSENYLEPLEKFVLMDSIDEVTKLLKERTQGADIGVKILMADATCEDYNCSKIFTYYSKLERVKSKAIEEEFHQVGSLLKPIVYDTFIELGRNYDEEVSTDPIVLNLKSGRWAPKDYSKTKVDSVTLKYALQKSKNIPLVRVASEIGFDKLEEVLDFKIPKLQKPLAEYPAQLLGSIELSVKEVYETYLKFIKQKCNEIKNNNTGIEDTVLYFMSDAKETTISLVSQGPLRNLNIFGKTGTSNNGLDNWYFAFDGKTYYVVWFGVESNRDKYDLRISGASSAFRIFQNYVNYRGKLPSEIFCQ